MNPSSVHTSFSRRLVDFAAILVVFFGFSGSAPSQDQAKTDLPLAVTGIVIPDDQVSPFLDVLKKYASERNFEIRNFPKEGQRSVMMQIRLSPETFFLVHNPLSGNRFTVIAYSRDKPSSWTGEWEKLFGQLGARFGQERITVRQMPPASEKTK